MVQDAFHPITAEIILLSVLAAAAFTFLFVALIYLIDRYEKEPVWLLASSFLWGAIPSIIAAFILNTIFSLPPYLILGPEIADVIGSSLIAPPVEETLKGAALLAILFLWRDEIDSLLDGLIYGAMVGMGFAMVENIFYFLSVYSENGMEAWQINIFMRAFIFGLNHALFTSMTGLGIAASRLSKRRSVQVGAPILGWLAAIFLHFVHNLSVSLGGILLLVTIANAWGGVALVLVIAAWALIQERSWIKQYLKEEVLLGTLTADQYSTAYSNWRRAVHLLRLLATRGLPGYVNGTRFYHRCSELAYNKRHYDRLHDNRSHEKSEKLRREIAGLSSLVT